MLSLGHGMAIPTINSLELCDESVFQQTPLIKLRVQKGGRGREVVRETCWRYMGWEELRVSRERESGRHK